MSEKQITIGTLSKLTGAHIKSLRYYDKLGILPPAYVDPLTNYRYYTLDQIHLVDAIQFCIELDIPLKYFQTFQSENKDTIYYTKLIDYGAKFAYEKIKAIQMRLEMLENVQLELIHGEEMMNTKEVISFFQPEKTYYLTPYEGTLTCPSYFTLLTKSIVHLKSQNILFRYNMGILGRYQDGRMKSFLYIELSGNDISPGPNIMKLSAGSYSCKKTMTHHITDAKELFPELFQTNQETFVFEVELYTHDHKLTNTAYELRATNVTLQD